MLNQRHSGGPRGIWVTVLVFGLSWSAGSSASSFCPPVYEAGVMGPLPFTTAFTTIDEFNDGNGGQEDGLLISSFFNSIKDPTGENVVGFFEDDLVAIIRDIGAVDPATFDPNTDVERLTDLGGGVPVTVWPNGIDRLPEGMLPFEGVVMPQGFHPTPPQGRLSIINMDDPGRQEYIVDQSTQLPFPPNICPFPPNEINAPRFYHQVRYVDMDVDGFLDIVTVRAAFKVAGGFCVPPVGEVVWFKNPGAGLDPNTPWQENIISGFPTDPFSAEINIDVYDFEGDGVPEIIGTHFFNGELITIYGAPPGQPWSAVSPFFNPPRKKDIVTDQGSPFEVEVVDLNRDGRVEVLATNHQSDNCFAVTQAPIPGRVFAVEQPDSGDIFNDDWTVRILLDDIRPNPTFPEPSSGPGRLAPGRAIAFWPKRQDELDGKKPWIVVGGDEASKVWLLKPKKESSKNWEYKSAVLFDINDYYGANASQMLDAPAPSQGNSISTIGGQSIRYDGPGADARAEIYVPVFEGREIHKFSFRPQGSMTQVDCVDDVQVACPAP